MSTFIPVTKDSLAKPSLRGQLFPAEACSMAGVLAVWDVVALAQINKQQESKKWHANQVHPSSQQWYRFWLSYKLVYCIFCLLCLGTHLKELRAYLKGFHCLQLIARVKRKITQCWSRAGKLQLYLQVVMATHQGKAGRQKHGKSSFLVVFRLRALFLSPASTLTGGLLLSSYICLPHTSSGLYSSSLYPSFRCFLR